MRHLELFEIIGRKQGPFQFPSSPQNVHYQDKNSKCFGKICIQLSFQLLVYSQILTCPKGKRYWYWLRGGIGCLRRDLGGLRGPTGD